MEYIHRFFQLKNKHTIFFYENRKSRKPWVTSSPVVDVTDFFPQLLLPVVHLFNISTASRVRANEDHHPEEATKIVICELFAFKETHSRSSRWVLCAHTMPPETVPAEFGPVGTSWVHSHCTALTQPVLLSRYRVCGK